MKKKINLKNRLKKFAMGTISLFLVVLLTPFMTIATILIEAQHYNSSVALLDEAMGVSSVSLLADYDEYLKNRWGLITVDQFSDMNENFEKYLQINTSILGNSLTINDTYVNGMHNIKDDKELFEKQILQYSKYNVTTKGAADLTAGILDLVGITEKLKNLKSIDNWLNLINNGEKTADSMISVYDSQKNIQKSSDELRKKIEACNKKFNGDNWSFESKMNELTEEMKKENADAKKIEKKKNEYNKKRQEYINKIDELISALGVYKSDAKALGTAMSNMKKNLKATVDSTIKVTDDTIQNLQKDFNEAKNKVENYSGDKESDAYKQLLKDKDDADIALAKAKTEKSMADATENGLYSMETSYASFENKCSEAFIDAQIEKLNKLKDSIPTADEIKKESTAGEYSIGNIEYATVNEIKQFIEQQENATNNSGLSSFINGIIATMNSLVKCSAFYEPALRAVVDIGGDADCPATRAIKGIASALNGISQFEEGGSFKKRWEGIKNICSGIGQTITSIQEFSTNMMTDIPENVINLFTTDRFWYTMYSYYMLTCRTDYSKSNFKTGYPKMGTVLGTAPYLKRTEWQNNIPIGGEGNAFVETFKRIASLGNSKEGDSDTTFYGAEMEYLICGSQAELANQVCVFMMTYMLRLLIDAPAVVLDEEVQAMAEAAGAATFGVGTAIVYVLEILLEPFVDTLILVNGGKIPFYETTVYLSPSGIFEFITNVAPGLSFTEAQKTEIKNSVNSAFKDGNTSGGSGGKVSLSKEPTKPNKGSGTKNLIPKIDYRQQCLILMLLFVTNDDMINRLQSVIQMETKYYYQDTKKADFSLDKSYTFVEVGADVKIKQILPSLTDSSLFEVKRKIYRGY